ncbi:hypothetical protein ACH5RR_025628 [Cinchona calisaya]|uniref:Integrase zinc-binding domain-containing protein n=1 Tax=Cinchona calisaya TaxID=153742 RepID=A0ABD2Z0P3_9GENT
MEVGDSCLGDPEAEKLICEQTIKTGENSDWAFVDGILKYKGKLYIGCKNGVRQKIIEALHSSQQGGHSRIQASLQRAKTWFYWPGMKQDIEEAILECDVL